MVFNTANEHPNSAMADYRDVDQNIPSPCILLLEIDHDLTRTVIDYLKGHDMHVFAASGSQCAMRCLAQFSPSVVILDLQHGNELGLGLLRQVRESSEVPVIIVSGHGCNELDRVIGLELGADDFITKPFGLRELLARIRAVLRRQRYTVRNPPQLEKTIRFRFGGWQLERDTRRLISPTGALIKLTKTDFAILLAFLEAPQRPLTREYLLQATRVHADVFDRSIDVQVLRLRRKLEIESSYPRMIVTERGFGYMFALRVERN